MASLVDWESAETYVMGADAPALPELTGHIWISSSGTSKKKWIALSKEAFLVSAAAVNGHFGVTKDDRWLQPLPNHHVGGLSVWARSHLSGCAVIDYPDVTRKKWDATHYYQTLSNSKTTVTSLVPTQLYDLVANGFKSPHALRAVIIGGDYLSKPLYLQARTLGWPVIPTYGCTECCSQIATGTLHDPTLRLLPHIEAKIDQTLMVRSEALLSYIFDRELIDPKQEGWFNTGDDATLEGNTLLPQGRCDDQVKIAGEKVHLGPLRQLLSDLTDAPNVTLYPAGNDRIGISLTLIGEKGVDLESLRDQFNQMVPRYAQIRAVKQVESLNRNALGKVCSA